MQAPTDMLPNRNQVKATNPPVSLSPSTSSVYSNPRPKQPRPSNRYSMLEYTAWTPSRIRVNLLKQLSCSPPLLHRLLPIPRCAHHPLPAQTQRHRALGIVTASHGFVQVALCVTCFQSEHDFQTACVARVLVRVLDWGK